MRKMLFVIVLSLLATKFFAQQALPNNISKADKIYGLSKFWQEVNYNFVYIDKIDRAAWDSTYRAMIAQVENTTNDYDYYRLLQKFCATLHDGHTNVWMPGSLANLQLTKMFGNYWFGTQNIDGKAIITHTLKAKMKEIPVGSEVIEVNGLPTARYLADSVKPYISSSTDYVQEDDAIATMLMGLPGATYNVKIKRPDGSILPLSLVHAKTADTAYYPPFETYNLLDFKWYKDGIAYVALNSFGDEKIDSIFETKLPELYKAKAVIIDLRKNGGGSTGIGTDILQYFMQDSIMQHSRYYTRQHMGAFKAWGKFVATKDTAGNEWNTKAWNYNHDKVMYSFDYSPDTIHLPAKRITVPVVVLIGHGTASAAEDFLISADNLKQFTKMGERSFGSTGQPFMFDMPGLGGARVCTKKDTYPDGREFVGYGVKPDIEVKPTVQDFIDNKDPVIDAAVKYLGKKI